MNIAVAIQKGGAGKTTTTLNLGAALARQGKSVLLVDLDPQANLTQSMGVPEDNPGGVYELLKQAATGESVDIRQHILQDTALPLLPANLDLANAELELVSIYGRETLLQQLLEPIAIEYDVILLDCPPAMGMLTVNALAAAHYVLMPLQAEYLPFKAVQSFTRHLELIKRQLNKKLKILGLVLTQYDERKTIHRDIRRQLEESYEGLVLDTSIRSNIALAQAQAARSDIFRFDAQAHGAKDYQRLATEILEKINNVHA